MATKLTKKQQTQLTEKLSGIIQKNNALQLRLSMDNSVNEMNVNQISGALNRIHGQAIGKDLPTVVTIPVNQSGSGVPSPDNIRPIVGYEIDGIGTVYGGELNIETGVLTVPYGGVDLGTLDWARAVTSVEGVARMQTTDLARVIKRPPSNSVKGSLICEKYETLSLGDVYEQHTGVCVTLNGAVNIFDPDYKLDTASNFQIAMSGIMLVYELETPETYTLTLQQMLQLLDQL